MYKEKLKLSKFNIRFKVKGSNYLYNTLTNALINLGENLDALNFDDNDKKLLTDNGFLVPENLDEVNEVISNINEMISDNDFESVDLTILLTNKCNYHCCYCYQEKYNYFLEEKVEKQILEEIELMFKKGVSNINVHYFGGEPLLNYKILKKIDEQIKILSKKYNVIYNSIITTNGALLTENIIKTISFKQINLTFDGNEYYHNKLKNSIGNSYKNNINLIKTIISNSKSNIQIRFNVCKENMESFKETIDDIFSIENIDEDRIYFNIEKLKKEFNSINSKEFTELLEKEFAKIHFKIIKLLQKKGVRFRLPISLSEPCPFMTGKSVAINTNGKISYCYKDFNKATETFSFEQLQKAKKQYEHKLLSKCKECTIMPMCINYCKLNCEDDNSCSELKYELIDILRDFLENDDKWIL